jgi:predicted nucleic acid-binding protein
VVIYLDVSCLNRPFDDQDQPRIRLESEAVVLILSQCDHGNWRQVSSEMAKIEIEAIKDVVRRDRVRLLLPEADHIVPVSPTVLDRAKKLFSLGIKPADAVHIAAAEGRKVDVFLTCDDRLLRAAKRNKSSLTTAIWNPLDWLRNNATDT